jgi:peroxiredoxin
MTRNSGLALLALILLGGVLPAGKYNDVLSPGDAAPAWADLPGVDGKKHSLADLKDKDVVVVVFTCCSCPAAEDYEDRIIAFAKKHAAADAKVAVVAISVNTGDEDGMPEMKERAAKKKFPFPYLHDESQKIGRAYGAEYTPEFFVLNKDRKVVYMGAMDDRDDPAKVKVKYVEEAVQAALKGEKPATAETVARGCRIPYPRKKK